MHTYLGSRKSTDLKSSSSSESEMILSTDARLQKMFICRCKSRISLYQAFAHSLTYFLTLIALLLKFPIIEIFFKLTLLFFKVREKTSQRTTKKNKRNSKF